jgi:YggT family protein
VVYVVYVVVMVYSWLIVARALMSWLPMRSDSPFLPLKQALFKLTDPYLRLFRRVVPIVRIGSAGVDLSALLGLVVLFIVMQVLIRV